MVQRPHRAAAESRQRRAALHQRVVGDHPRVHEPRRLLAASDGVASAAAAAAASGDELRQRRRAVPRRPVWAVGWDDDHPLAVSALQRRCGCGQFRPRHQRLGRQLPLRLLRIAAHPSRLRGHAVRASARRVPKGLGTVGRGQSAPRRPPRGGGKVRHVRVERPNRVLQPVDGGALLVVLLRIVRWPGNRGQRHPVRLHGHSGQPLPGQPVRLPSGARQRRGPTTALRRHNNNGAGVRLPPARAAALRVSGGAGNARIAVADVPLRQVALPDKRVGLAGVADLRRRLGGARRRAAARVGECGDPARAAVGAVGAERARGVVRAGPAVVAVAVVGVVDQPDAAARQPRAHAAVVEAPARQRRRRRRRRQRRRVLAADARLQRREILRAAAHGARLVVRRQRERVVAVAPPELPREDTLSVC